MPRALNHGVVNTHYTSTIQQGLTPSWKHSFALVSNLTVSCVLCIFVQWKGAHAQRTWIFSLHPLFPFVLKLLSTYRGLSPSYQRRLCFPLFFWLIIVHEHHSSITSSDRLWNPFCVVFVPSRLARLAPTKSGLFQLCVAWCALKILWS